MNMDFIKYSAIITIPKNKKKVKDDMIPNLNNIGLRDVNIWEFPSSTVY